MTCQFKEFFWTPNFEISHGHLGLVQVRWGCIQIWLHNVVVFGSLTKSLAGV